MKNQNPRSIDDVFGTLKVEAIDPNDVSRVLATCYLCGKTGSYLSNNLIGGRTRSCGSLECQKAYREMRLAAEAEKAQKVA
jgi:hypothetical protein